MVQFVQKLNGTLPAVPLNCGRALRYSWGLFSGSCWRFLGSIPSKIWAVFVRPYTGERLLDRGFTRLHCGPSVWANSIYSMDGFLVTPYNGGDVFKRIPPQKKYIYLCSGLGILWKFAQTGAKRKKKLSKKRRCEIFLAIAVFFIFRQFFIFRKLLDTICWGRVEFAYLFVVFAHYWNPKMKLYMDDRTASWSNVQNPIQLWGLFCWILSANVWWKKVSFAKCSTTFGRRVPYISMSRMDHLLP